MDRRCPDCDRQLDEDSWCSFCDSDKSIDPADNPAEHCAMGQCVREELATAYSEIKRNGKLIDLIYVDADGENPNPQTWKDLAMTTADEMEKEIASLTKRAEAAEAKLEALENEIDFNKQLAAAVLPCGHNSRYGFTDNGGKTGYCTLCQIAQLQAKLETLTTGTFAAEAEEHWELQVTRKALEMVCEQDPATAPAWWLEKARAALEPRREQTK